MSYAACSGAGIQYAAEDRKFVIIAHLSDLHLGFRAYGRVVGGADMRERDVSAAFERAVQELIRLRPDVVVVAGDVFDRPDPPASAVVALARGLESMSTALPDTRILMVAGPRDTPRRSGDPGALAVLDTLSNVDAVTARTQRIEIDRLGLNACLVPYRAVVRSAPPLPDPDPRMRWNLLVMHAEAVRGETTGIMIDPEEWDYVALGGEHQRKKLSQRVRYPGSLERVALDPWEEAGDEKGFLTANLETGQVSFHTIPVRPVVALAPVKVGPQGDPDRVRRKVREVLGGVPGGITDKIVRLRLQGARPNDLLALQGEPLRALRGEALHLAVEADKDLPVPVEAWLPVDYEAQVRNTVLAELEHDGKRSLETERVIKEILQRSSSVSDDRPIGAVQALDGVISGFGRVSTSIPTGLTAILGGGGRARRAVADLFRSAGSTGPETALSRWWSGTDGETLDGSLRRAIDAVAESRGTSLVDAALESLGATIPPEMAVSPPQNRLRGAGGINREQVAEEFKVAQRELLARRADVTEVDGDLEVATMDWLRERQDAETTLFAYRDRARELRRRIRSMEARGLEAPCPTCGRVLDSHYEEVLTELTEEWESVVQDGTWWKSRWEQLEMKPQHLQDLERTALRLHSAVEAGSERVEVLRVRIGELDGAKVAPLNELDDTRGAVAAALIRVRVARIARSKDLLLDRSSRFVSRVSGGRVLALTFEDGVVRLQGSDGALNPLSEEDLAVGRIAIRLAVASLISAQGRHVASLPIEHPFDSLGTEARIRALVLTKQLLNEVPRIVLFSRGDAVDARPELFDYVLEVRDDEAVTGPVLRPAPSGPGKIEIRSGSSDTVQRAGFVPTAM
jgi:exonuclease SbcD